MTNHKFTFKKLINFKWRRS